MRNNKSNFYYHYSIDQNRARLFLLVAVLILFLLPLAGCGGGGGNGSSGPGTPPPDPPTRTRQLTEGLTFKYRFNGEIDGLPGVLGEVTTRILAGTLAGEAVWMEDQTFNLYSQQRSLYQSERNYLQQGEDREVRHVGEETWRGPARFASPVRQLPGQYARNLTFADRGTRQEGGMVARSLRVTGVERVTVPAGTFLCWKVETVFTTTDISRNIIAYIDPTLGYPVKQVILHRDSAESGGMTFAGTAELAEVQNGVVVKEKDSGPERY